MKDFDEWFFEKYGSSFKEMHWFPGQPYDILMEELMNSVREYVSYLRGIE